MPDPTYPARLPTGAATVAEQQTQTTHLATLAGKGVVAGGNSIQLTLTVTNGVYTIADAVGGLLTFANAVRVNGGLGIVNTVKLAGVVAIPYELWLYSADLATPAIADNAPFVLAAADGAKFLGMIPITAAHYGAAQTAFNNATVPGVGIEYKAAGTGTSIFGYLKATATTSPATTTLYLTLDVEYLS